MKNLIGIFLVIFLFSCKGNNESKSQDHSTQANKLKSNELLIEFNFKTNKLDVFKIMMNNIEVDEFQKKNIHILEEVPPSSDFESIIAKFDSENISNNIVFHLGNKELKEVIIQNIKVSYRDKSIDISTIEDIEIYLGLNKYVVQDSIQKKKLKTKRIQGKHNPTFFLRHRLINELKKE